MSIVVVSWNVHGWVGGDRRRDHRRSFEAIRSFDADVLALQEVAGSEWRELARDHGYTAISGPTTPDYGNALLVRTRVATVSRLDLSVANREPRGALDVTVEHPRGSLRVVATHLGLRLSERRYQVSRLARHLDISAAGTPVVVIGDLNDWTPRGRQLAPIARIVGAFSRVKTFPSRRPILPLDRAACRTPGLTPHVSAIRDGGAQWASDHLPLRVALAHAGDATGTERALARGGPATSRTTSTRRRTSV